MPRLLGMPILIALVLCACVTINVYFPAAEAREAAREFVEKVIGEDGEAPPPGAVPPGDGGMASGNLRFDPLMLLGIGTAHAQTPDITIRTPVIQAIQARMESRFNSVLRKHFDSGALGFAGDGTIVVRDASKHIEILTRVIPDLAAHGIGYRGLCHSPIKGPAGNIEFFLHADIGYGSPPGAADCARTIERVVVEAHRALGDVKNG